MGSNKIRITVSDFDKRQLEIDFDFDWDLVEDVKQITGRQYNDSNEVWRVSLNERNLVDFLSFCQKNDITISNDKVKKVVERVKEDAQKKHDKYEENKELATKKEPDLDKVYGLRRGMSLYPFQRVAVEYIAKNKNVLIGDEMGLGKTISSLGAMEHLESYPTLIVCPASLKQNWKNEAESWLPKKRSINVINASDDNPTFRRRVVIINYALLRKYKETLLDKDWKMIVADESHYLKNEDAKRTQNFKKVAKNVPYKLLLSGTPITNRPSELISQLKILDVFEDEFGGWWEYVNNYCLPPNAPILMEDFTEKSIHKIEKGDKVIGWGTKNSKNRALQITEVIGKYKRNTKLIKAELENGDIIKCTPDHKWLTGRGGFGTTKKVRKWKTIPSNTQYKSKIAKLLRTNSDINIKNKNYARGYLIGAFRGDGWLTKKEISKKRPWRNKPDIERKEYSIGIATKDKEIIDRCEDYFKKFNLTANRRLRKDGLHEITSGYPETFKFLTTSYNKNKKWYKGFLAGIYDTDGSGTLISQHKKVNKQTKKLIEETLEKLNFENYKSDYSSTTKIKIGKTGRNSLLRLYKICNPAVKRKLKEHIMNAAGRFFSESVKVKSTEVLKENAEVYTLETKTGNYIAYGYGSKNCDAQKTQWGMDISGASNLKELHEKLISTCYVRRNKEDVLKQLPEKSRKVVKFNIMNRDKYRKVENNIVQYFRDKALKDDEFQEEIEGLPEFQQEKLKKEKATKAMSKAIGAEHLVKLSELRKVTAKGKLKPITDWIDNFIKSEQKLVLFAHHTAVCDAIEEKYDCLKITGEVPSEDRQEIVDKFQNDADEQLIILNIAAGGVGITLTEASHVGFIELPWSPAAVEQGEDRCHRISQENAVNIYYLLAEDTIDEKVHSLIEKKRKVTNKVNAGKNLTEDDLKELEKESDITKELIKNLLDKND